MIMHTKRRKKKAKKAARKANIKVLVSDHTSNIYDEQKVYLDFFVNINVP
jgi:hypothetical protein